MFAWLENGRGVEEGESRRGPLKALLRGIRLGKVLLCGFCNDLLMILELRREDFQSTRDNSSLNNTYT